MADAGTEFALSDRDQVRVFIDGAREAALSTGLDPGDSVLIQRDLDYMEAELAGEEPDLEGLRTAGARVRAVLAGVSDPR